MEFLELTERGKLKCSANNRALAAHKLRGGVKRPITCQNKTLDKVWHPQRQTLMGPFLASKIPRFSMFSGFQVFKHIIFMPIFSLQSFLVVLI